MSFKAYWNNLYSQSITKAISQARVRGVRDKIRTSREGGKSNVNTVREAKREAKGMRGLDKPWKMDRLVRTEMARIDNNHTKNLRLPGQGFRVRVKKTACPQCVGFFLHKNRQPKVFYDKRRLRKGGYSVPPLHPNCRCELYHVGKVE